jgi:hypothetical protein
MVSILRSCVTLESGEEWISTKKFRERRRFNLNLQT